MFKSKLGSPVPSCSSACQCSRLLLLQSPLFCCCCFVSLVSFSTVKQRPGPVLPPWGTTDYCQTNSMCMCDLHLQKIMWCEYSMHKLFWWHNLCLTHCMLSLAYVYKLKHTLGFTVHKAILRNFQLRTPSCYEEVRKSNNVFSRYIFLYSL